MTLAAESLIISKLKENCGSELWLTFIKAFNGAAAAESARPQPFLRYFMTARAPIRIASIAAFRTRERERERERDKAFSWRETRAAKIEVAVARHLAQPEQPPKWQRGKSTSKKECDQGSKLTA